ncbi:MAG: hypothetical protein NUV49_04230 [Patescibacteria group bacterium]|nr:hypothetical protein [Patescibacteria group bacterium]
MYTDFASEDVFDSRDVDARIEELEAEEERINDENEEKKQEIEEHNAELEEGEEPEEFEAEEMDEGEKEELRILREFKDDCGSREWKYGLAFINDDYFTEYAEETAYDIGAVDRNANWPVMFIDWDAAAEALKQDYLTIELEGNTFYYRG